MAVWVGFKNVNCQACNDDGKRVRGCNGLEAPYFLTDIEVEINKCPVKEISTQSIIFIEAYHLYKAGILPRNTGWLKLPIKFTEAMRVIDSVMSKLGEKQNAQ